MAIAKYYTTEECGKWTKFPFEFEKEFLDPFIRPNSSKLNHNTPMGIGHSGSDIFAYSIMFSDGSIYDSGDKCRFRNESEFPHDEIIEYMNNVLAVE